MKKASQSPIYYPMFLNIRGKKCLVVGGGEVALRKTKVLLESDANVEVVSPTLCPELGKLAKDGHVKVLKRGYRKKDMHGAMIAIAATDDVIINQKVAYDARLQGVLVNVVNAPEHSDFIVPSYFKRGNVTIAVSTSGKSPALARKIRIRIEKDIADEYAELATLISEVRTELNQQNTMIDGDVWQEAIDMDSLIHLLQDGKRRNAKKMIIKRLNEAGGNRAI